MNEKQAHKQAAKASKTSGAQYVAYVFDQGRDAQAPSSARRYAPLIQIEAAYEAAYMGGAQVATAEALATA